MAVTMACTSLLTIGLLTVWMIGAIVKGQLPCNSTTSGPGVITSPNYPNDYPSNTNCWWTIRAPSTLSVVVLKLVNFTLQDPTTFRCLNDYVYLYDGELNDRKITDPSICGKASDYRSSYVSSSNTMTIFFHSDDSLNFQGFNLQYSIQEKSSLCGSTQLMANETRQFILSPNYDEHYQGQIDCQWDITASGPLQVVTLRLVEFELPINISDGSMTFYDGMTTNQPVFATLSGKQPDTTRFTSTWRYMTITLHYDFYDIYRSFKLEYSSQNKTDQCNNARIYVNKIDQYISSPGYPNVYASQQNCQWTLIPSLSTNVVKLEFMQFSLEGNPSQCGNDAVTLFDGLSANNNKLTSLCGQVANGTTIISSGNYMTVLFKSSSQNSKLPGFRIRVTSQDPTDLCWKAPREATTAWAEFTSPGYPYNYPNNLNCVYQLTTNAISQVVQIKILDFNVSGEWGENCLSDKVIIYDGGVSENVKIETMCGYAPTANETYYSGSSTMNIAFITDYAIFAQGFRFQYRAVNKTDLCGNNLLAGHSGNTFPLNSPNFPRRYPSDLRCEWHIHANAASEAVKVSVSNFQIDTVGSDCLNGDYLAVYDGPTADDSKRIDVLCGNLAKEYMTSTGNDITVVFVSDNLISIGQKYELQATIVKKPDSCKDVSLTATLNAKTLQSPNYGDSFGYSYPSNTDCEWHIKADSSNHIVSIDFISFFLEGVKNNCTQDYVTFYDGPSSSSSVLETLCGDIREIFTVASTGSSITIHFHSNEIISYSGFYAQYKRGKTINSAVSLGAAILPMFLLAIVSSWSSGWISA